MKTRTIRAYRNDNLMSEAYEDADHQPRAVGSGYTRLDCRYHALGYCNEEFYSGFKDRSLVLKITKDDLGRTLNEVWLDAQQHPVPGLQGWAWRKLVYAPDSQAILSEEVHGRFREPDRENPRWVLECPLRLQLRGLLEAKEFGDSTARRATPSSASPSTPAAVTRGSATSTPIGKKAWCRDGLPLQDYRRRSRPESFELILEDFDPSRFAYFRNRVKSTVRNGKCDSDRRPASRIATGIPSTSRRLQRS